MPQKLMFNFFQVFQTLSLQNDDGLHITMLFNEHPTGFYIIQPTSENIKSYNKINNISGLVLRATIGTKKDRVLKKQSLKWEFSAV